MICIYSKDVIFVNYIQSSYLSQPPVQADEQSYYSDSEQSSHESINVPMHRNAFTSRRRLERFVGRRRTNSESNNTTTEIYRPDCQLALPATEGTSAVVSSSSHEHDSVSVDVPMGTHGNGNDEDDEFDSAPELADMELIHRILKRSKHKNIPKRTTSFTSYNINRQVCREKP